MDEATNPAEQTSGSQQQVDWKARFDGQVRKIEELTLRNRDLESQLAEKSSEIEQLRAQLALKDTEKSAAVGERDKTIQELVTSKSSLEEELARLRALALKVKVAKDIKRPDLLPVLDTIPDMSDEEALKNVLTTLSSYADNLVRERERQLLAGVTPAISAGAAEAPGVPKSEQEWQQFINSLPLGSKERGKAFDDYWNWLVAKHQPK